MGRLPMTIATTLLAAAFITGCATAPKTSAERQQLQTEAQACIKLARQTDATLSTLLDHAAAYAVFPSVGKGAAGVGGAYGRGILYENGKMTAYCDLSQISIGAQLGGQSYTEIICFQTPAAVKDFKQGKTAFDAQASAVALESGSGANADYSHGVAVFTMGESGAMFEASIGGQKFSCQPLQFLD